MIQKNIQFFSSIFLLMSMQAHAMDSVSKDVPGPFEKDKKIRYTRMIGGNDYLVEFSTDALNGINLAQKIPMYLHEFLAGDSEVIRKRLFQYCSDDITACLLEPILKCEQKRKEANIFLEPITEVTVGESYLIRGKGNGVVLVLDSKTSECLKGLHGHTEQVISIDVFDDKERVVTASQDGSVYVWHIPTGKCLQVLKKASGMISSVKTVGDDRVEVVLNDKDETTLLYEFPSPLALSTLTLILLIKLEDARQQREYYHLGEFFKKNAWISIFCALPEQARDRYRDRITEHAMDVGCANATAGICSLF